MITGVDLNAYDTRETFLEDAHVTLVAASIDHGEIEAFALRRQLGPGAYMMDLCTRTGVKRLWRLDGAKAERRHGPAERVEALAARARHAGVDHDKLDAANAIAERAGQR